MKLTTLETLQSIKETIEKGIAEMTSKAKQHREKGEDFLANMERDQASGLYFALGAIEYHIERLTKETK